MASKCEITCGVIEEHGDLSKDGSEVKYFEFTTDGRVWPCCFYVALWFQFNVETDPQYKELYLSDPVLKELYENDPDWNNTKVKELDEILSHPVFMEYITESGFESDNQPVVCKHYCGKCE